MGGYPGFGTRRLKIGAKLTLLHGGGNPFGLMCQFLAMSRSAIPRWYYKNTFVFFRCLGGREPDLDGWISRIWHTKVKNWS